MSMKYDAAGRLLRRTTRVPFEDIAVSGKLQQVTAKADLSALSSRLIARNGAASAAGTAGASSGSSAASPSLAPSTTLQGTPSSVSSSVVPAISGKVSMRALSFRRLCDIRQESAAGVPLLPEGPLGQCACGVQRA